MAPNQCLVDPPTDRPVGSWFYLEYVQTQEQAPYTKCEPTPQNIGR